MGRKPAAPQIVVGVDQNNVVVHHNPGESDHADASHDNSKRPPCDHQTQQYPGNSADDRAYYRQRRIQAVYPKSRRWVMCSLGR